MSYVLSPVSCVLCPMSYVLCHIMSYVLCSMSYVDSRYSLTWYTQTPLNNTSCSIPLAMLSDLFLQPPKYTCCMFTSYIMVRHPRGDLKGSLLGSFWGFWDHPLRPEEPCHFEDPLDRIRVPIWVAQCAHSTVNSSRTESSRFLVEGSFVAQFWALALVSLVLTLVALVLALASLAPALVALACIGSCVALCYVL